MHNVHTWEREVATWLSCGCQRSCRYPRPPAATSVGHAPMPPLMMMMRSFSNLHLQVPASDAGVRWRTAQDRDPTTDARPLTPSLGRQIFGWR